MSAPSLSTAAAAQAAVSAAQLFSLKILRMSAAEVAQTLDAERAINPCLEIPAASAADAGIAAENIRGGSLQDSLRRQLRETPTSPSARQQAQALVDWVDDEGYLRAPPPDFNAGLRLLQTLSPAGVGAPDLRGSLLLQLERIGKAKGAPPAAVLKAARRLVQNHLPALLRKRRDLLPRAHLQDALAVIKKLRARPGGGFAPPAMPPDVAFVRRRGLWRAEAAAGLSFSARLIENSGAPAERRRARALLSAVANRRRVTLRVAQYAADRQAGFLNGGDSALSPLSQKTAAEELGVSAGFLSHALCHKTAACKSAEFNNSANSTNTPRRFALARMFPRAGAAGRAGAALAAAVREAAVGEDARRPYTDEELRLRLAARGVFIARRTVAKYRRQSGIAPRSLRKEF